VAFCQKCGSPLPDAAAFCQRCGSSLSATPAAAPLPSQAAAAPALAPATALYYLSSFATRQVSGPFNDAAIRTMIVQRQISMNDSVAVQGSNDWVPVAQSVFASNMAQQLNMDRVASSTCPQCGAAMAVVIKRSGLGLALIIIGVVLTPAFGIGVPIWIAGMIIRWGGKGKAAYRCPRCNFST
jgi:zinc-ribbon domain